MATRAYAYPTSPVEDGGTRERLHADLVLDSTKLCMYKAMAGASTGDPSKFRGILDDTRQLRATFLVPFDDDVWAVVLAYLYNFPYLGAYDSYSTAKSAIESCATGDVIYISIGSTDPEKSGHAIYAKKLTDKVEYHDNEFSDTSKIAPKFQTGFTFLLFKKAGGAPKISVLSFKIANMPQNMILTLQLAREGWGDIVIGAQKASGRTRTDVAELYTKRAGKRNSVLRSCADLDTAKDEVANWDRSMRKV